MSRTLIQGMWDEWSAGAVNSGSDTDAECAGLLSGLLSRSVCSFSVRPVSVPNIQLKPRHTRVARRLLKLWRKTSWVSQWDVAVNVPQNIMGQDTGERVTISLPSDFLDELFQVAERMADSPAHWSWLRGLWGSCGGLYLPKSGYYLVMRARADEIAEPLRKILDQTQIPWRERTHCGAQEMSLRDIESIVTFLCNLGLSSAALKLEERSIVRSMRDQANRVRNCDTANIKRAIPVAKEQVRLAQSIVNQGFLSRLPVPLRELVEVRLANPEASLGELGEKLSQPITKSSVRYKWGKLRDYVANLN